jgi:hypothetical protein
VINDQHYVPRRISVIRAASILWLLLIAVGLMPAADSHTDVTLGVVTPGQNVNATATPPGTPLTGDVDNPGGWPWVKLTILSYDATVPYSYAGAHEATFKGTYVVPGSGGGTGPGRVLTWDMTATATVPTVTVSVASATLDLLDDNTYTATTNPPGLTISSTIFYVARQGSDAWEAVNTPGATYALKERVAGHLKLKCTSVVNSSSINSSNEVPFEVRFPHYTKLQQLCGGVFTRYWNDTLAATTPTSRREQFSWIVVDTNRGVTGLTPPVLGTPAGPDEGAGIDPPSRPGDNPASPRPLVDRPLYIVGWFHTHTPTTYTTTGRPTGPSGPDAIFSMDQQIPGFAYDYTAISIPKGYPMNSPASSQPIEPPPRRPTP